MSDESIAAAVRDYLEVLDRLTGGSSREYFPSLYSNRPGAWHSMVRNLRYGLRHFPAGLVVDMCCGDGLQAYVFTKHGREVLGIDEQAPRIELARQAAEELGVNIEYRAGDVTVDVRDIRAGAIWMHRALGHIHTLEQYVRDCHTALEPHGAFVFMTSNSASRKLLPGVREGQYTVPYLRNLLETSGFDVEDVRYHGYLSAVPERLLPPKVDQIEDTLSKVPLVSRMSGSFSMAAYAR